MVYTTSRFAGSFLIPDLIGSLSIKGLLQYSSFIIAANRLSISYECLTLTRTLIRRSLFLKLSNGLELHVTIALLTQQSHGVITNLLLSRNQRIELSLMIKWPKERLYATRFQLFHSRPFIDRRVYRAISRASRRRGWWYNRGNRSYLRR